MGHEYIPVLNSMVFLGPTSFTSTCHTNFYWIFQDPPIHTSDLASATLTNLVTWDNYKQ